MSTEDYSNVVEKNEESLELYAKKSFEPFSKTFVDGGDYFGVYLSQWEDSERRSRIASRTPLQIERDRILYSRGMRKLTEKYHVIYRGSRRIIRNFTTHTMRMSQVARAISGALGLNPDFAEAVALGAKVGAPPFVHASKEIVSKWIEGKLRKLDKDREERGSGKRSVEDQRQLFQDLVSDAKIPGWVREVRSADLVGRIKQYMPWAAGEDVDKPFSSGSQGYWSLCTNPYLVKSRSLRFSPETMFGIWRHSLGLSHGKDCFVHKFKIEDATSGYHEIKWDNITYESLVVRYADDITWVIENLDDANSASLLAGGAPLYLDILSELRAKGKVPVDLQDALMDRDSGSLYNYFITEFVQHSRAVLRQLGEGAHYRIALREGKREAMIGLSPEADEQLRKMKKFLDRRVFSEPRVANRFQILESISRACLELLYEGRPDALEAYVKDQAKIMNLTEEDQERAVALVQEPVHRIQLVVSIFSDMSDQEIYDFVGIQGL